MRNTERRTGRRSPAAGPRRSRRRPAIARRGGPAPHDARRPREIIARITGTPLLARAVPRLPAELLHAVVQTCGLEDCGELLALATTGQLSDVFDLDLWHTDPALTEQVFDASRFCSWLEVLAEQSVPDAARRLAELDASLVTTGLASTIAVFDPGVFVPPAAADDSDAMIPAALDGELRSDVGGYVVVARRVDSWDTINAVLTAMAEEHPDSFHRVMRACRRLSNSKPEVDGLDDLLTDPEQARFDLAVGREDRLDEKGYVTPAQARAFLESSRHLQLDGDPSPSAHPIFTAYLRAAASHRERDQRSRSSSRAGDPDPAEPDCALAAVVDALVHAGVVAGNPRALLTAKEQEAPLRSRLDEQMQLAWERDADAASLRGQELAFLANVLVAGCSIQGRALSPREAYDAAAATCNLGLDNWPRRWLCPARSDPAAVAPITIPPDDFLLRHDLVTVFQVGWTVLHENVSMFVAERLIEALADVRPGDSETLWALAELRRELTTHCRVSAPWHARQALDVIAILDMPAWAALAALIDELPVMLANVGAAGASRPKSISMSAFEFISSNADIAAVRAFVLSLPESLAG